MTHPDPQALLDAFAGTGDPVSGAPGQAGFRERVDFGQTIGTHVDLYGVAAPTSKGIIRYGASGQAHLVPARP